MLSCVGQTDLGGHGGRAEEIRLVDEGPTTAEINAVALRTAAEAQAKANAASAGRGVRMAKRKYNLCLLFIHPGAPNLISLRSASTIPA